jgi:hypothetical protein
MLILQVSAARTAAYDRRHRFSIYTVFAIFSIPYGAVYEAIYCPIFVTSQGVKTVAI